MNKEKLNNTVYRRALIRRATILFWCFANALIIALISMAFHTQEMIMLLLDRPEMWVLTGIMVFSAYIVASAYNTNLIGNPLNIVSDGWALYKKGWKQIGTLLIRRKS